VNSVAISLGQDIDHDNIQVRVRIHDAEEPSVVSVRSEDLQDLVADTIRDYEAAPTGAKEF